MRFFVLYDCFKESINVFKIELISVKHEVARDGVMTLRASNRDM